MNVASAVPQKYLINLNDFYEIATKHEDKRLELIEGEIVDMGKIGNKHAACVDSLNYLLTIQIGQSARVRVQNPIHLSDLSEPVPDLSLLRFRQDFYKQAHPTPNDILLLIEVADSSLKYDQDTKIPLYGFYQISEVWLVNLKQNKITAYWEPQQRGYAQQHDFKPGEQISPRQFPHLKLPVSEILGL
jgi:Uma2 family endonuclease